MAETIDQPSAWPNRKITYASIASAIAFVIVLLVKSYLIPEMDSQLTGALLLILTAAAGPVAGYLVAEWKDPDATEESG